MKFEYLPPEDKQNLRVLRNKRNPEEVAKILESISYRAPTFQVIWEYRKYFYMLSDKEFEKYPHLKVGMANIKIMEGNLQETRRIIDTIEEPTPEEWAIKKFPLITKEFLKPNFIIIKAYKA